MCMRGRCCYIGFTQCVSMTHAGTVLLHWFYAMCKHDTCRDKAACVVVVHVECLGLVLGVHGSSKPGGAVHLKALWACALRRTVKGTLFCTSEKPTSAQSECLMSHGNVSEVNIGLW